MEIKLDINEHFKGFISEDKSDWLEVMEVAKATMWQLDLL